MFDFESALELDLGLAFSALVESAAFVAEVEDTFSDACSCPFGCKSEATFAESDAFSFEPVDSEFDAAALFISASLLVELVPSDLGSVDSLAAAASAGPAVALVAGTEPPSVLELAASLGWEANDGVDSVSTAPLSLGAAATSVGGAPSPSLEGGLVSVSDILGEEQSSSFEKKK